MHLLSIEYAHSWLEECLMFKNQETISLTAWVNICIIWRRIKKRYISGWRHHKVLGLAAAMDMMSFGVMEMSRFRVFMRTAVSKSWKGDPCMHLYVQFELQHMFWANLQASTQFISTYQYVKLHLPPASKAVLKAFLPKWAAFGIMCNLKNTEDLKWMQQSWSVVQGFNNSWKTSGGAM